MLTIRSIKRTYVLESDSVVGISLSQAYLADSSPLGVAQLAKEGALKLSSVRHFILDECDKMLDKMGAHPRTLLLLWWLLVVSCVAATVSVLVIGYFCKQ